MQLYHTTGADTLEAIATEGLRPGSCWYNSKDLTRYYAETISDKGREPRILSIDIDALKAACKAAKVSLLPDFPDLASIEEPITVALGKKEEQIWEEWRATEGTWVDSLAIVSSLKCPIAIAPCQLQVIDMDSSDEMRLSDYVDLVDNDFKSKKSTRKPPSEF